MFSYFFGNSSVNTTASPNTVAPDTAVPDNASPATQTTAETSGPKHILAHWQGDCSGSMQSMGNAPMDGGRNFCNEFRELAKSDQTIPVTISFYTFSGLNKSSLNELSSAPCTIMLSSGHREHRGSAACMMMGLVWWWWVG